MASPQPCYDIREVANLTGLEESTIQYYERVFADLLPEKVFRADQALFQPGAVDLLRNIRQWVSARALTTDEIRSLLLLQRRSPARTEPVQLGKVLGITSGKGGVGKSNLALNLALELQRRGHRTALLDADLGTANLHILAGVTPERTLYDVTHGTAGIADVMTEGPEGLGLIAGGSGVCQLANLPRHRRFSLISELEKLEKCVEVLVVDTAPGIAGNVTDFLQVADLCLVVTTPDLTAITDAYALVKTLLAEGEVERLGIVANMVRGVRQAENLFQRLSGCIRRFLDFDVEYVGHMPKDQAVTRATEKRTPFLVLEPEARISKAVCALADTLENGFLKGTKYESSLSRLWATWSRFNESLSGTPAFGGSTNATPGAEGSTYSTSDGGGSTSLCEGRVECKSL